MGETTTKSDVSSELTTWLKARQSSLKITKTTISRNGQIIDWVPIESQISGSVPAPPPANRPVPEADTLRPTTSVKLEATEQGPAGHVPILRPDISKFKNLTDFKNILSKKGIVRTKAGAVTHSANTKPNDPNPAGYFHASSAESVTSYGCEAFLNVWDPQIDIPSAPGDDHSISQTWLTNNTTANFQTLEAGLTVDKNLNGDLSNHIFTFYTTNDYTEEGDNLGGYNRLQKGWVQYHPTIFPGIRIGNSSTYGEGQVEIGIKFELYQGNWWFGVIVEGSVGWTWLGYYPATLYTGGLRTAGNNLSFGGEVNSTLANPCSTRDQMGSGFQAVDGWAQAAFQRALRNQNATDGAMANFNGTTETDAAATTCTNNPYTIQAFMNSGSTWGSYQYYGGPSAINYISPLVKSLAASNQFGIGGQTDVFSIDKAGAMSVAWVVDAGKWTGSQPIGRAGLFPANAAIATSRQFGINGQTDIFAVSNEGALNVAWVVNAGAWGGPGAIGKAGLFKPGAGVAASNQFGIDNQTDLFAVDLHGTLNVAWVVAAGAWGGPGAIGKAGTFPSGALLAACNQAGIPHQTDVFGVDNNGALNVAWVVGGGAWGGPGAIGPNGLFPPGAAVACIAQQGVANQTDVFCVDKRGALNVAWVVGAGKWNGPVAITGPGIFPPGAPIAVSPQFGINGQTDVFCVDVRGTLNVLWVVNAGRWGGPGRLRTIRHQRPDRRLRRRQERDHQRGLGRKCRRLERPGANRLNAQTYTFRPDLRQPNASPPGGAFF